MTPRAKWPSGVAKTLALPEQTLAANLIASAQKFAQRTAIIFHGAHYDYQTLLDQVEKPPSSPEPASTKELPTVVL